MDKKESKTFSRYLAGIKDEDLDKLLVAGENLTEGRMEISIYDLPSWIRSDANFKLKMLPQDFKLIRDFFRRPKSKIFTPGLGGKSVHLGFMKAEDWQWNGRRGDEGYVSEGYVSKEEHA